MYRKWSNVIKFRRSKSRKWDQIAEIGPGNTNALQYVEVVGREKVKTKDGSIRSFSLKDRQLTLPTTWLC